ncbi:GEVED domain-containing protein [Flavobacteriales bacterium]|nr:GEVED domain-containing protein [Flavobacteriales bacterium]
MKNFLFLPGFKTLFSLLIIIIPFVGQAQCTHTLNMVDSYGDGWNGGVLTINVNGASVGTFTIGSGSSGTGTFSASDGDDIDVYWSSTGSWASERSWSIDDGYGAGTEIGSGNGTSTVNDLVGNCSPPPTNIVPVTGATTHTDCSGSVYDAGGSGGNYSSSSDGILKIYPSTVGALVNITGTSTTENNYDYVYVFDGPTTADPLLGTYTGTGQAINHTSSHASGALTIRLTSDGSVTASGLDLAVSCVIPCLAPSALTSSSITATTATISWTAPSPAPSDGYDYYYDPSSSAPSNSATPSGSVAAGVLTDNLSGLTAGTTYYYWVRSNCGSGDLSDWTSSSSFTTSEAAPTITSFTPSGGCASLAEVVVTGTNFGGVTIMTIGGTAVTSFTVDNSTQITAIVGTGSDGVIYVENTAGNASSGSSFTFTVGSASITTQPEATLDIAAGNSDVISVVATGASSYQWQYSEDNIAWSNIADGTPANVTYSGATTANLSIQPNTSVAGAVGYYKCVAQCGDVSSSSATVTFVQYCSQTGGTDSGVVGVTFGTIDNTTSNPYIPPYSDYYNEFEEQFLRNTSYDLNVYVNTGGAYTNYQTAWIDWDGSGTFDGDEEYDLGIADEVTNGLSSNCPVSITVPSDAVEGNIRMRILSVYNVAGSACASFTYGEVEDYRLVVRFPNIWGGAIDTDWHTTANWTSNELPTPLSIIEIPASANLPVVSQDVTVASLTIDATADVTCSSGSLTVLGALLNNGTLNIGKSTVNTDGDFDGTAGSIVMTDAAANLTLSSTVTSLGGLNTDLGTVTYDGSTQNVLVDTYNNLSIATAGVKTALGTLTLNGNLTTAATNGSRLDMGANQLNMAGNLTVGAQNGLDLTDASALLTLNGTADQSITHPGNATAAGGSTVTEDYTTQAIFMTTDNSGSYDAFTNSGTTATTLTGPSAGNGGSGTYIYFEGSGGFNGETNYITETFDFSTYNSPQISYYYHMFGLDIGSLALQVNVGSGWTSLWSVSGMQQGSSESGFGQNTVSLAAYAGEASCQVRFLATRADGFDSDIALDDIVVSDLVGAITGNFEFVNLTVNNTGGNIDLLSDVEMDGALTLTTGDIDASKKTLTLSSSATSSAGSDASHVIGTMVKTTAATSPFTFPLGDGTWYKAIGITPDATSSTVWTAEYFNSEYATTTVDPANTGDIDHISAYEYWDLDKSGSANAVIALPWVSQNAVSVYADLRLAHFDGTDWDMITATPVGDNTSGVVTSGSAVTTYSPFTLASSTSSNTLPIELVSFSGEKKDNRNILNWTTASEINNAYFTIEKSYNGFDFEWVGTQEGTSPSTQIINYSLSDYDVLETLNYYRLKQTDFDGKFEYSNTISIDNRVDNSFKEIMGRTNLLGQEVDEFYNGIVIVRYKDGTSQKFYQFK